MRPHRLELTNQLVLSYGLHEKMSYHAPRAATEEELLQFHEADYVDFLKRYVKRTQRIPYTDILHPQSYPKKCSSTNKRLDEIQCRWWLPHLLRFILFLQTICGWFARRREETFKWKCRHCYQLEWWITSCKERWSKWILLCERYRFGYPWAFKVRPVVRSKLISSDPIVDIILVCSTLISTSIMEMACRKPFISPIVFSPSPFTNTLPISFLTPVIYQKLGLIWASISVLMSLCKMASMMSPTYHCLKQWWSQPSLYSSLQLLYYSAVQIL